ncbi:hypothetical protein FA15DRAFT_667756 [Coprinopsis marcescibilis]|uniref:RING-type domain-containing protein n=1 Tax=Coprinopsis marcescibilis TaxID=230819 RepID=A0A5C3L0U7_COPMA|nr:hypothetical protein FA15DRAFT_667756 [Coprinopsis marcescibilis]
MTTVSPSPSESPTSTTTRTSRHIDIKGKQKATVSDDSDVWDGLAIVPKSEFGRQTCLQAPDPSKLKSYRSSQQERLAALRNSDGSDDLNAPPMYREDDIDEFQALRTKKHLDHISSPPNSKRYTQDFGWQLALQELSTKPTLVPVGMDGLGSNSLANDEDVSIRPPSTPFSTLDLDSAAKAFSSFATTSEQNRTQQQPEAPPTNTHPHASDSRYSTLLREKDSNPHKPRSQSFRRGEALPLVMAESPAIAAFHCQHCRAQIQIINAAQIPSCDHIVCLTCLTDYILEELDSSRFPIKCPVCLEDDNGSPLTGHGIITLQVAEICPLPSGAVTLLQEYALAANSTKVYCPKCQETMLVDRQQYLEESVITCPLRNCMHRWCKFCFRDMPSGNRGDHKCKPKNKGSRNCPGCSVPGKRLISTNNHIKCQGIGCRIHFCYQCGETIADEAAMEDQQLVDDAIIIHYQTCKRSTIQQGGSCTLM